MNKKIINQNDKIVYPIQITLILLETGCVHHPRLH